MAVRRYEISLWVLKNISRVSAANEWNIFQREKRNFVSPSGHVMFYLLYKHQWNAKPFHFNIFLAAKGAMYHVAIATVIFSHVKITCYFHMWRYHVFVRKLTWYFIGIYIIKRDISSILISCPQSVKWLYLAGAHCKRRASHKRGQYHFLGEILIFPSGTHLIFTQTCFDIKNVCRFVFFASFSRLNRAKR